MLRVLVLLLAAIGASAAETIKVQIRREVPAEIRDTVTFPLSEEQEVPLATSGCEGTARLHALRFRFSMTTEGQTVYVDQFVEAELEKIAQGPLAPPSLTIDGEHPLSHVFERSMADAGWENGGTFKELIRNEQMQLPKFWKSVTLDCSGESPYSSRVIPEGVVYKRGDPKALADAAALLGNALRGFRGFATPALYDTDMMVIIGPDLYAGIGADPVLQKVSSPKAMMIDPNTNKQRAMLRVKGGDEAAAFNAAMRRYLGDAKPRIRAATSAELARYWLNIGWDIEEPLLIADYGAHRIVFDFKDGRVMMVDEISYPP